MSLPVVDGRVDVAWSDIPQGATDADGLSTLVFARTSRDVVQTDEGSLLLSSGQWEFKNLQLLPSGIVPLTVAPDPIPNAEVVTFSVISGTPRWALGAPPLVKLSNRTADAVDVIDSQQLRVTMNTAGLSGNQLLTTTTGGSLDGVGRPGVGTSELPVCDAQEEEPNDEGPGNGLFVGQVVCGELSQGGDADWYSFDAVLGVTYRFETWASRLNAPTDTVLEVYSADSGSPLVLPLVTNDDFQASEHTDSRLDWSATSSEPLFVRVVGYGGAGGPDHVYRLESSVVP
jgi:hypothetical protein